MPEDYNTIKCNDVDNTNNKGSNTDLGIRCICKSAPFRQACSEHLHHMMTVQSLVTGGCEAKRLHSIALEDPACAQLC